MELEISMRPRNITISMRQKNLLMRLILILFFTSTIVSAGEGSIIQFGAKGDGESLNTEAIQAAIDKTASSGGGTIVVPKGIFLSGAVFDITYLGISIPFFIFSLVLSKFIKDKYKMNNIY